MRLDGHQRGTTDILIHHQRYHERYHADGVLDGSAAQLLQHRVWCAADAGPALQCTKGFFSRSQLLEQTDSVPIAPFRVH